VGSFSETESILKNCQIKLCLFLISEILDHFKGRLTSDNSDNIDVEVLGLTKDILN